jgi:folate-dependent tRNA-U54 methylase TrmFO/GidA
MDELIRQAPMDLDEVFIKEIYEKNNGDFMNSLMELWEVKNVVKEQQTTEQKEWDNIRETCDIFDGEMNKMMSKIRTRTI